LAQSHVPTGGTDPQEVPHGFGNLSSLFPLYARLDSKRTAEGLSATELEIWSGLKRHLTLHFSPGFVGDVDLRSSVRIPTRLECSVESPGNAEVALITNLSKGGVFVETHAPLTVGTTLWLRIRLCDGGTALAVPGVVVSSTVGTNGGSGKTGMGIKFAVALSEMVRAIDDLYQQTIAREFGELSTNAEKPQNDFESDPLDR
jgi:Tfp pilus assembly protein PilZ